METKNCQNCKNDFTIEPEDFEFYDKIKVPPPTFCPVCRLQRRLSWRNERGLYKRQNNTPGENNEIISIYPDSANVTVYTNKYWWSDGWDPKSYGMDYDFTKSFFEQFNELVHRVPLIDLFDQNGINTNYCNTVVNHKNCYMVTAGWDNEDSAYSNRISFCKETFDCYTCHKTEFCYQCVNCKDSYKLFYSELSFNCTDSNFLYDCRNCINCTLCTNQRNKSYCFLNKQYSKEEYQKLINELGLEEKKNVENAKEVFKKLKLNSIHKYAELTNCTNTIGDNLENSKNAKYCFDLAGGVENSKFCNWGTYGLTDSYDTGPGTGGKSELTYEGISIGVGNTNCKFGAILWNSVDTEYAFNSYSLKNCFGCVSLRNAEYCILNKQYTKEEYFILVEKIKIHMTEMFYTDKIGNIYKYGEFMPIELSPFPYNGTVAQDFFPLNKEKTKDKNYNYEDEVKREYSTTLNINNLPQSIADVDEDIYNEVIECENYNRNVTNCSNAFKIVEQEFEFYKRFNIPLPTKCFNCRHNDRLQQRNPLKLWHRTCMNAGCSNEFETAYSPDRPEKVYCESCYNKEIY